MTRPKQVRGAGARTLELLRWIAAGEREFTLKDLAAKVALAPSTVHRLLSQWVEADMIESFGTGAYRLGPELFRVASLVLQKFDTPRLARPLLEELWKQWQETASFCLYKPASGTATIVDSLRSPHPLQLVFEPFEEFALPWGSMGRAILAQLPPDEVAAVLSRSPRSRLAQRPPPPAHTLRAELARIKRDGHAVYEDDVLDIAGISAPVFAAGGEVLGCIGVTMPASRFRKVPARELAASVMEGARRLSDALAFRSSGAQPPSPTRRGPRHEGNHAPNKGV